MHFQGKQLLVLDAQIQAQADSRADERAANKEAHDANDRLLNAVHEVIHYLTETLLNGEPSLAQREQALSAAKQVLGASHPIYVMLQVTAK